MTQTRRSYSTAEKQELWDRWQRGDRLTDIAAGLGRKPGSLYGQFKEAGGIRPPERRRNAQALTLREREVISRGLAARETVRTIARRLGRAPSTVSREITRNGGRCRYRAAKADDRAWDAARRPKLCKLALHAPLRRVVAKKLESNWSPEQIAGWLRHRYADDENMTISHEAIYRSLFVQARGVLRRELIEHLRTQRRFRQSARKQPSRQGQILDAVTIRKRPAEASDRAIPGHWEGDLLVGADNTQIATLVERRSRFTALVRITRKDAGTVRTALSRKIRGLPRDLVRTLTWDRGTEMAQHVRLSIESDIAIYFCDPQSPWQRGTNENTNRLLRQYFPKGTRLDGYSQAALDRTARELNTRPRKTLDFRTPVEIFTEALP